MQVSEQQLSVIVEKVIEKLREVKTAGHFPVRKNTLDEMQSSVFNKVEDAITAAKAAFENLKKKTLKERQSYIEAIRGTFREHTGELAIEIENETGLGRAEDKVQKLSLVIEKTPGTEDIQPQVFTGDHGISLVERAPFGVIGAVTPVTNPVETIICNAIGFISGGNTAVFNPHPNSKSVCAHAVYLINEAVTSIGGPSNLISSIWEPTIASAQELMNHREVRLVVVTGGGGVVKAAMQSGKRVIAAGPGNPPAVVDETADISAAARDIVMGASMDNNIICVLEKEIIAVDSIVDQLKREMKNHQAIELTPHQVERLTKIVVKDNAPNKEFTGKDAAVLLEQIDIKPKEDIRLIFAEVEENHPIVQLEMMMPFIGLVRVKNVEGAIAAAVRCEHGFHHTATMHSRNIDNLSNMAKCINTTLFVKNGPSLAGLGYEGEGYTSFTIAGPTGEGLTTARTFTRERRCTLKDYFRII